MPSQIRNIPASATHLVLSAGGNDALGYLKVIDGLQDEQMRYPEAIGKLREFQADLQEKYEPAIDQLMEVGLPTMFCMVYNGNFDSKQLQATIDTILPVINHTIREAALRRGLPLIDLVRALDEPDLDYANPIEPAGPPGLLEP